MLVSAPVKFEGNCGLYMSQKQFVNEWVVINPKCSSQCCVRAPIANQRHNLLSRLTGIFLEIYQQKKICILLMRVPFF